jgi:hypothetical protein
MRCLAKDSCQRDMGHLGLDELCRYLFGHCYRVLLIGASKMEKGTCLVCPNDNCYESNDGGAHKLDV